MKKIYVFVKPHPQLGYSLNEICEPPQAHIDLAPDHFIPIDEVFPNEFPFRDELIRNGFESVDQLNKESLSVAGFTNEKIEVIMSAKDSEIKPPKTDPYKPNHGVEIPVSEPVKKSSKKK